jgi:hypothetical protein
MVTVLFVHGTGTREPHFSVMVERVGAALEGHALVRPCYWGESQGSKLNAAGASIPSYDSTRSLAELLRVVEPDRPEDYEVAIWDLLVKDPLVELRLLANTSGPTDGLSPKEGGQSLDFDRLTAWEATLPAGSEVRRQIDAAALGSLLAEACEIVGQSDAFLGAVFTGDKKVFRLAVARAVVAVTFLLANQRDLPAPARTDPKLRDDIVDGFAQILGGGAQIEAHVSARGFLNDLLIKPLMGLVVNAGTNIASNQIRRRRGAIHDATTAAAGDILLYEARGEGIRRFIKNSIVKLGGPVILIAHSLGGIACVDLLILEQIPQVRLLITMGSQAPFFYEINALQSMEFRDESPGNRLPSHFPRWLNFYDLRDFLSYVGEPIFGNDIVTDVCVDNRLPFPDSHGGYFSNDRVWQTVLGILPSATK